MRRKTKLLVKDIGEIGLIERIAKLIGDADPDVLVSIGDDAAVIKPKYQYLQVLTTDILLEDVHFRVDTYTPFEIGYKAVVVNVSDVTAMAGKPRYALVSIGLDLQTSVDFVDGLYRGMSKAADDYDLSLVGGDTTKSAKLIVNVTVRGYVEAEMLRRRSDAVVKDQIAVTGELGGSAAGLYLLSNPRKDGSTPCSEELRKAHIAPKARLEEARIAAKIGARAMEDISDGLASEIRHICDASNVGARLEVSSVPIAHGVKEVAALMGKKMHDLALYGGEDFELVFTAPKSKIEKIKEEIFKATGTKVAIVGEIVQSRKGISLLYPNGEESRLTEYGFAHF